MTMLLDDVLDDADRCLVRDAAVLALSRPDAAGYLHKRANISGWYRYWFSLHGSQLRYFEVVASDRRGPLVGVISLFRNKVTVAHSVKRPREIDLVDASSKAHVLRADGDTELHWWLQAFAFARKKIPPPKPFSSTASTILPRPATVCSLPASGSLNTIASQGSAGLASTHEGLDQGGSCIVENTPPGQLRSTDKRVKGVSGLPFGIAANASADQRSRPALSSDSTWPGGLPVSAKAASAESPAGREALFQSASRPTYSRDVPVVSALSRSSFPASNTGSAKTMPTTSVENHLPVNHVMFVVHGIGSSEDILIENIRTLQESYNEISSKIFPDLNFRVEMLVVRWRDSLTELDVHQKLKSVVPIAPSLSGESNPLRQFMVHRIVDYVYYTHDRYRRHIMRTVTSQLNEMITDFKCRRPDYRGCISIFAHSLGAALCYDLLCRKYRDDKKLLAAEGMLIDFEVDNLFMAGSPLGTFLHLDPAMAMGADARTLPFRVYNIFHPNDPVATRLEPYVDMSFVGVHPVLVPYWCNMGVRSSTAQWLGTLWSGSSYKKFTEKGKDSKESPNDGNECPPEHAVAERTYSGVGPVETPISKSSDSWRDDFRKSVSNVRSAADGDDDTPTSGDAEISSTSAVMQPSPGQIGIGAGLEVDIMDAGSTDVDSELRYLSQAAQDEILARGVFDRRLDFVLQLSSTIEEVSTSWSALRAHTDYWSNRDMMLIMISSMIKSSYGIPDNVSRTPTVETSRRLIDSQVHLKDTRIGWATKPDSNINGDAGKAADILPLDDVVHNFVEKMIDEAASMHELVRMHPNMRLRRGGITRSTSSLSEHRDILPQSNISEAKQTGWSTYLRWFNGSSNGESSKSIPMVKSYVDNVSQMPSKHRK